MTTSYSIVAIYELCSDTLYRISDICLWIICLGLGFCSFSTGDRCNILRLRLHTLNNMTCVGFIS